MSFRPPAIDPPFEDHLVEPPKPGDHNYDPEVHEPMRFYYQHEHRRREQAVAIEEVRQLASEIEACFLKNGVNAYQVCRPLCVEYRKRTVVWKDYIPPVGEETDSVVDNSWFQYSTRPQKDWH